MPYVRDTIAALATARGRAALAIIRISGSEARSIVASCFQGSNLKQAASHSVHVGYVTASDGSSIDQVVVTLFVAPRSVTGEDVVEISCHGGDFASQLILRRLFEQGARMAEPGEFTQRAFLNGKMDLAQAEAVADLIHASSSLAHHVSVSHLQGRYSDWLKKLREELLETSALVELELDFSEEDVAFVNTQRLLVLLNKSEKLLHQLLQSYQTGEKIRDGIRVVIGGRPNAGKSTLLNALLGRDRAIVSAIPGTTRDEIEAEAEINGLRFRFVDTAGLREVTDAVEAEGVRRARYSIETCDVLVYVYDLSIGLTDDEISYIKKIGKQTYKTPVLLVGNKRDLVQDVNAPNLLGIPFVGLSASCGLKTLEEIGPLLHELMDLVGVELSSIEASPVIMNHRHRQHLSRALKAVQDAKEACNRGASDEKLALDLRLALDELGAITGEVTNEDVLDQIFSRFCIGK